MMKTKLMILLVLILALMVFAGCDGAGGASDSSKTQDTSEEANVSLEAENPSDSDDGTPVVADTSQETGSGETRETSGGSNLAQSGEIQGVVYRILGCRELTKEEYDPGYDGMVGVLVDMVIENTGDDIISLAPMMAFEIEGDSGESYSVDAFAKTFSGDLSTLAGKGKIITGSFVFPANVEDSGFRLNITPDFMSDDALVLSFEKGQIYEDNTYQSSTDGKGLGSQFDNEELSYVINDVSFLQEEDHMSLSIFMTVLNNTSDDYDEYQIPFTLIGQDGIECSLSYKMGNSELAGIPASGSKEVEIIYEIKSPDVTEYDLYLSPMGRNDRWDMIHFSID